jgi:hypothetical protein
LGLRIRNSHDGSNGRDIGNLRWSINSLHIVGILWPLTEAPGMPIVAAKVMMPWAIPAIGIPMGVIWWIWIGFDG